MQILYFPSLSLSCLCSHLCARIKTGRKTKFPSMFWTSTLSHIQYFIFLSIYSTNFWCIISVLYNTYGRAPEMCSQISKECPSVLKSSPYVWAETLWISWGSCKQSCKYNLTGSVVTFRTSKCMAPSIGNNEKEHQNAHVIEKPSNWFGGYIYSTLKYIGEW